MPHSLTRIRSSHTNTGEIQRVRSGCAATTSAPHWLRITPERGFVRGSCASWPDDGV